MEPGIKRFHYYHAEVSALGGRIERPIDHMLSVQAPLSLPPTGGYATTRTEGFQLQGLLSYKSAYSQVAGSISNKDGGWTTLSTVAVEGVNVHDILTADRVVAQISTQHPLEGDSTICGLPDIHLRFLSTSICAARETGTPKSPVSRMNVFWRPRPSNTAAWRMRSACRHG